MNAEKKSMQKIFAPSLTETKTCLFQLRRLIENMNEDVVTWTLSLVHSLTHLNDPVDHL